MGKPRDALLNRRRVLTGLGVFAGVSAVASVLSACGGSAAGAATAPAAAAPTSAPAAAAPTTAPAAAPTTAPAPSGAATSAGPVATTAPAAAAPSTAATAGGRTTVNYWQTIPSKDDDQLAIPAFEKQNPDIKINGQWIPGGEMFEKLQTSFAAGESPDCHIVFISWVRDFFKLGMLSPLNTLSKQTFGTDTFPDDKYFAASAQAVTVDGKVAAVPMGLEQIMLYWNRDHFKAANIPEPDQDPNFSYDKVLETAQALTKRTGSKTDQYGMFSYWNYAALDSPILANGGRLLSEDQTESRIDSPENLNTLQWHVDLIRKYKVAPEPSVFQDTGTSKFFLSGKVSMYVDGTWVLQNIQEDPNFNGQIGLMPMGKAKRTAIYWPDSMAISAKSKVQDAAWKWVVYLATNPAPKSFRYVVPFVRAASADPGWLDKDRKGNKQALLDQTKYWQPEEIGTRWNEWRQKVCNNEFQAAFLGEKKPEDALKAAHQQTNDILHRP